MLKVKQTIIYNKYNKYNLIQWVMDTNRTIYSRQINENKEDDDEGEAERKHLCHFRYFTHLKQINYLLLGIVSLLRV